MNTPPEIDALTALQRRTLLLEHNCTFLVGLVKDIGELLSRDEQHDNRELGKAAIRAAQTVNKSLVETAER